MNIIFWVEGMNILSIWWDEHPRTYLLVQEKMGIISEVPEDEHNFL